MKRYIDGKKKYFCDNCYRETYVLFWTTAGDFCLECYALFKKLKEFNEGEKQYKNTKN